MSINVSGADATYSSVTYGGNTGTLYEFIDPAETGNFTITGTLSNGDATAWLIGGGGGGGNGDSTSYGGGGGGGQVLTEVSLHTLTEDTYNIKIGTGGSGALNNGNTTYIHIGLTLHITAYGGGYGGNVDNAGEDAISSDSILGLGGVAGSFGLGGSSEICGGGGGGGGISSGNGLGGNGGSAISDGNSSGDSVNGQNISGFTGTSLPITFTLGYTFGDGGAAGQSVTGGSRYGRGGNGGNTTSQTGLSGNEGALYIFVKGSAITSAPPAPTNAAVFVSKTDTQIVVTGSSFVESGGPFTAANFYIALGSANGTVADTGTTTYNSGSSLYTHTFTGLSESTQYNITWTLSNAAGESTQSTGISVTTDAGSGPPLPTAIQIGAVSNITSSGFTIAFTGGSGTGVTYTANATTDTVNYNSPFVSGTINSSTKIITFTGLESSTSYGIVLTASNGGGNVVVSVDLDANGEPFTTIPSTPPQLTLSIKTSTSITVTGDTSNITDNFTSLKFYSQEGNNSPKLNTNDSTEVAKIYTIEYTGLAPSTTYNLTWKISNDTYDSTASDPLPVTTLSGGNPPCFLRGSKILCLKENKEQYVAVEDMRVGMEVKTLKGAYVKVHTIGNTMFNNPDNADRGPNRLFRLTPSNYPELTEDLIITGCHSRLVEKLEPKQKARHLQLMKSLYMTTDMFRLMAFIDEKAEPYLNPGKHEIWHFALENEVEVCNYGVYANGGLLVETASIKNMRERSGLALIE